MRRLSISLYAFVLLLISMCPLHTSGKGFELRLLNHWDNPDGTVERGYAGHSIFWKKDGVADLDVVRQYGKMNQAIGINGTVLNNVNAKPFMLSREKLEETKRIADALRPYGIRVYLSVNFASPKALGGLPTADPLDPQVRQWWKDKAKEIYSLIPDFGGFLVKANSEGEPGPMDYGRTHVDGANMLADALSSAWNEAKQPNNQTTQQPNNPTTQQPNNQTTKQPNNQTTKQPIVMWRAFVYSATGGDRASQAYEEFMPYDGQFADNVIIQVKIGPVDFQPREPLSPLLFGMKKTKMMVEVQLTQEYTGECIHTCFMPNYTLPTSLLGKKNITGIAGVSNIGDGTIKNLPSLGGVGGGLGGAISCGSIMSQANWYAFGRYASDPSLTKNQIAHEWLSRTFTTDTSFVNPMTKLLVESHDVVTRYMMPLGLHHIFAGGHHYGPEPWCDPKGWREDWKPRYYHKADKNGIGFDRTVATGTGNTRLYPDSLYNLYENIGTCPEDLLLWFHHVPWTYHMHNGETLWDALCHQYDQGVREAEQFNETWQKAVKVLKSNTSSISPDVIDRQTIFFARQAKDAWWWRDACLLYFQQFSGMPLPKDSPAPRHKLEDLMNFHLDMDNYSTADITKLP